ncbi:MAG: hypothetical protein HC888_01790 [Candidatus Competibacteraceae bacterium]|nr:hypothetical protein [Candidatus Competibacteraceae bacterium]
MIRKKRVFSQQVPIKDNVKGWQNTLAGLPAFLIGNGPSIEGIEWSMLDGRFTIGINRVFPPYCPLDPTILFWQDPETWYNEKQHISKTRAIKYCRDTADLSGRFFHFKLGSGGYRLPTDAERLYGRGASGPLAFQLAFVMGCNPIILLGMDCCYRDGKTNYYGKNRYHSKHTLGNCQKGLEWIRDCGSGRFIINCSSNSVFDRRLTIDEALQQLGDAKKLDRANLHKKILG